jgi:hypothetical protein
MYVNDRIENHVSLSYIVVTCFMPIVYIGLNGSGEGFKC